METDIMERVFTYVINADDKIDGVSSEWLQFARENQASHLNAETVIGRSLFEFMSNEETRHLYGMILERVRQSESEVVLSFRCDGPSVRRYMELDVSPMAGGHVQFRSWVVREEERETVPLFDSLSWRSEEFLMVCSWCKRVEVEADWLEVEDAVERRELFSQTRLPQISHGICPECSTQLRRQVKQQLTSGELRSRP